MTEEELREIQRAWGTYAGPLEPVIQQVHALIAEVTRLRDENAALREIAQAMVQQEGDAGLTHVASSGTYECPWCYGDDTSGQRVRLGEFAHSPDCPVIRARALLL